MGQRVRVYLTCIRSIALYSISAIRVTEESLQLLSRMEAHHIRCIAGSARHVTFESTADLRKRLWFAGRGPMAPWCLGTTHPACVATAETEHQTFTPPSSAVSVSAV